MFMSEITPILNEFVKQPIAFLGGFASGLLRLNLADEPVKSWIDRQVGQSTVSTGEQSPSKQGPQSISID
ncbi:MAG: hypothetical protein NZ772_10555 [Cyanobacteria bacterium]|nr:hypothetical protein [Cyanobacteriota bacterium]MDW8201913.1 hypothetical protein [Cyanobacteriota bacterium SKYGB_h_bin112]